MKGHYFLWALYVSGMGSISSSMQYGAPPLKRDRPITYCDLLPLDIRLIYAQAFVKQWPTLFCATHSLSFFNICDQKVLQKYFNSDLLSIESIDFQLGLRSHESKKWLACAGVEKLATCSLAQKKNYLFSGFTHESPDEFIAATINALFQDNAIEQTVDIMRNNALMYAILYDRHTIATPLFETPLIHATNSHGDTPLHLASLVGAEWAVKQLLETDVCLTSCNVEHETPIILALKNNHHALAITLWDRCIINTQKVIKNFNTAVARYAQPDLIDKIITTYGRSIDDTGTELYDAALLAGNLYLVHKLLCTKLINPAIDDLVKAAQSGNDELLDYLLQKHTLAINGHDIHERTPLVAALYTVNNPLETIKKLIAHGAHVALSSQDLTNIPLSRACQMANSSELIEFLVKQGAPLEQKDINGRTALHHTIIKGTNTDFEYLLLQGADYEAVDSNKNTPLHLACKYFNPQIISILLQKQANVQAKNCDALTPLAIIAQNLEQMIARPHKVGGALENLLNAGAPYDSYQQRLCTYALENNLSSLFMTLHKIFGLNPNHTDESGSTYLMHACKNKSDSLVRLLLTKFITDPNRLNFKNRSALHYACKYFSQFKTIKRLLKAGAYANTIDYKGASALTLLIKSNACTAQQIQHCMSYISSIKLACLDPLIPAFPSEADSSIAVPGFHEIAKKIYADHQLDATE